MILSKVTVSRDFPPANAASTDKLQLLAARFPRPLRFLGVGGFGLLTDLCVFTAITAYGVHPLLARIFSLAAATLVTWRLNRALTFDGSHRHQGDEATRYAAVTVTAQGTSYTIFALLILTVMAAHPQAALLLGAACGAVIGYCGHRFFAFAPKFPPVQEKAPPR
jgi:putative flippase GtrA